MTINVCSKKVFIRKIKLKQNDSYFLLKGKYNIKDDVSYIQILKIKFNKENYKELHSKTLKDILKFSDTSNENNDELKKDIDDIGYKEIKLNKKINSLFGFIKFNMGYYAIFACDSEIIGKIGKNIMYSVDKLIYFPLFEVDEKYQKSTEYIQEKKYLNLLKSFSYDKQIYFSYSYNLSHTLQRNFVECFKKEMVDNFEKEAYISDKNNNEKISLEKATNYYFCWNYFHIEELFNIFSDKQIIQPWINYFIYGYVGQSLCVIKGLRFQITVIARRNRHYAGTRYLKRGITSDGSVANDVETEQIMEDVGFCWADRPKISSFVQIRGSIPIQWYQIQNSFYQKPEINVNLSDIRYKATKRHFASLIERYGVPCIAVNLTKKLEEGKKQETLLNELYSNGIQYINESINDETKKILYYHYDLKRDKENKDKVKDLCKTYYKILCPFISKTNLFSFIPSLKNKYIVTLQNGVIRANCIDCLDRTNVFQQIVGMSVLVAQLRFIGIDENFPENEKQNIYGVLNSLYVSMGHELANQYTGTISLKQTITDHRNFLDKIVDTTYEIIIACKRSMINYFSDQAKQNSMNLFLGKYLINSGEPFILDMPTDESLHKKKLEDLPNDWYIKNYETFKKFNLFKDIKDIELKKIEKNKKIIYIEKYVDNDSNNLLDINILREKKSEMSITSKLIFTGLYKDIDSLNDTSLIENYLNSDFNEYILDYTKYIQYKKENINQEEIDFENDSIYRYIIDIKDREIKEFILKSENGTNKLQEKNNNDNKNNERNNDKNDIHKNLEIQKLKKEFKFNTMNDKAIYSCPQEKLKNKLNISPFISSSVNTLRKNNLNESTKKLFNFENIDNGLTSPNLIYKIPNNNNSNNNNIYRLENFDVDENIEEDAITDFEKFYNFETEKKKEEQKNTKRNDIVYFDLNSNQIVKTVNLGDNNLIMKKESDEFKNNKINKNNKERESNFKKDDKKNLENEDNSDENKINTIGKNNDENNVYLKDCLKITLLKIGEIKTKEDYFSQEK